MVSISAGRHVVWRRCLRLAALSALLVGCMIREDCGQRSTSEETKHIEVPGGYRTPNKPFLMPYLDGSGVALVSAREEVLGGFESNLLDHPEGVPIGRLDAQGSDTAIDLRPNPPDVAVWNDRTIVWATRLKQGETSFRIGRIEAREYHHLLSVINMLSTNLACAQSDTDERIPASSNVVGAISVVTSQHRWVLATELPQMKSQQTYWFFDHGQFTELPMTGHSVEQFYSKLSPSYAAHVKSYVALYTTLEALRPSDGREIDTTSTLFWAVQSGQRYGVGP